MANFYAPYFLMDSKHRGASTIITLYTLIMYTIYASMVRFYIERKLKIKFFFDDANATSIIVSSCQLDLRSCESQKT